MKNSRFHFTGLLGWILVIAMAMAASSGGVAHAVMHYIGTLDQLQSIGNDPNCLPGDAYTLTQDIDASPTATWNGGAGFDPIGTSAKPFLGSFDGAGHVIRGLYINRSTTETIGLFGYVAAGSTIENLGLVGGSVTGISGCGFLAGINNGNVTNCHATGSVSGVSNIGGLIAGNGGVVSQCFATGNVTGSYYFAGGLMGINNGTVTNCYATGVVSGGPWAVGGLIGLNTNEGTTLSKSYATGLVTGTGGAIGGLVGSNYSGAVVTNCYWDMQTTNQSGSDGGIGKTTEQMKQQATFSGWDFSETWTIIENVSYPTLMPLDGINLIYIAGAHGTISGDTYQTVAPGDNGTTVTAVADPGYHFVEWTDHHTENPRIDTNVTTSVTVTAIFAPTPSQFKIRNPESGTTAATSDRFGRAVAISGDTAVIGAPYDDDAGADSGSAYVFTRSGGAWMLQAKLTAPDGAANDQFGRNVAISGDTAIIGVPSDDDTSISSGSAYVYTRSGGVWTQQAKLNAADPATNAYFGLAVAISGDTAVIGAYGNTSTAAGGSAYVFTRSGGVWSQQQKLTAADGATGDFFGNSVAIWDDTAVVGAENDDDVTTNSGSAYIFTRSGGGWSQQQKLTANDAAVSDTFGYDVAISGDVVVVGAVGDDDGGSSSGSVYVFALSGGVWALQQKLTAADAAASDSFGISVAISGDSAVVGAYGDDDGGTSSGSVYVFGHSGGVWSQQQKLTALDAAASDYLGWSVACDAEYVLAGAYYDDDPETDAGSAYVFTVGPMAAPAKAIVMSPVDGGLAVPVYSNLVWANGGGAASYNVYFGTSNPPAFLREQSETVYNPGPLSYNTDYFWRIDSKNSGGVTQGDTWTFRTEELITTPPNKAINISPVNGTTSASVHVYPSWTNGGGATSYNVYFGTTNPPAYRGEQAQTYYLPGTLNSNTTYYWRIDAKNVVGVTAGDTWTFRTETWHGMPNQAINPVPASSTTQVSINPTISWENGGGASSYVVYFGTTSNPPTFIGEQTETTYNPGPLTNDRSYYWRVDSKNVFGTTTGTIWNFRTETSYAVPSQPIYISPENGATSQPLSTRLRWVNGGGTNYYKVYFGDTYPPPYRTQTSNNYYYGPMSYESTYYWRIDAYNSYNGITTQGETWYFRTCPLTLPGKATVNMPFDGATTQSVTRSLMWYSGGGATSYDVYLGTTEPLPLVAEVTQSTSTTTASWIPPRMEPMTQYYWRIDSRNSAGMTPGDVWTFKTNYWPTRPTLYNPPNGATGQSITSTYLNWSSSSGATSFKVYLGETNPPPFMAEQTGTTTYYPAGLRAETTYFWRIDACNTTYTTPSATWSFRTETAYTAPNKAIIVNPPNGGTQQSVDSKLMWINGGGASSYDVYFGPSYPPAYVGERTESTYDPGTLGYGMTYYWQINSKNAYGTTTGDVWSFTTEPGAMPATPINPVPMDNAYEIDVSPVLSWQNATDGAVYNVSYDVYFGTQNPPGVKVASAITETSYAPGTLNCDTRYFWRVVAKNETGMNPGQVWTFMTMPNQPPGVPVNPVPLDGAIDIDLSPTLSWQCATEGRAFDVTYDVYFGTDSPPAQKVAGDIAETSYAPGPLQNDTKYYWQVVAKNSAGSASGSVWNFATIPLPGEIDVRDSIQPDNDLAVPFGNVDVGTSQTQTITIMNTDTSHSLRINNIGLGYYREDFDDGQAQGWTEDIDANWNVAGGQYVAHADSLDIMTTTYGGSHWDNMSASASYHISGPDYSSVYLFVRASDDFQPFIGSAYIFSLSTDGYYTVFKQVGGVTTGLQSAYSSLIQAGGNTIMASAEGSTLKLYVNNTLVWTGSDSSLISGRIGLGCADATGTANTFYFDNVIVARPLTGIAAPSAAQQWYNEQPTPGLITCWTPVQNLSAPVYNGPANDMEAPPITQTGWFRLENVPTLPLTLTPMTSITLNVVFEPTAIGEASDSVLIESNDDDEPQVAVALSATATGGQPISIVHTPLPDTTSIGAYDITAEITPVNAVSQARLYWTSGGNYNQPITMENIGGSTYYAQIPGALAPGYTVRYYIEVIDTLGFVHVSPLTAPETPYSFLVLGIPNLSVNPERMDFRLKPDTFHPRSFQVINTGTAATTWSVSLATPPVVVDTTTVTLNLPSGVVVVPPGYQAMETSARVAILAPAGGAGQLQAALAGFPDIAAADVLDVEYDVPTIEQLRAYDVVIAMDVNYIHQPTALGDVLADYLDSGGKVIQCAYTYMEGSGYDIQGRFSGGGYEPFTHCQFETGSHGLGAINSNHPLMAGIVSVSAEVVGMTALTTGSTLVASWSNGRPMAATHGHNVVGFNLLPGDTAGLMGGDWPLLFHNAVVWLKTGSWLRIIGPENGWLNAGESVSVFVEADTTGLVSNSHYDASLAIIGDANGVIKLPCGLDVYESLNVSPSANLECSGPQGGPFTPESIQYTLINNETYPVTWSATPNTNWVTVTPATGVLDPNTTTTVTVSITSETLILEPGTHWTMIAFSDGMTTCAALRSVELTARPAVALVWDNIPSPQYINQPFAVSIRAVDEFGQTVRGFNEGVYLNSDDGDVEPFNISGFVNGIWTGSLTVTGPATASMSIYAGVDETEIQGVSNAFEVWHGPVITVGIEPVEAIAAGAQWRLEPIDPPDTWRNSGETIEVLPGDYVVVYKPIAGWVTPSNGYCHVENGISDNKTGYYMENLGGVTITINPAEAVAAGAKWHLSPVDDSSTWHNSAETILYTPGDYTLQYKTVEGWTKPADEPVTVDLNSNTSRTGSYVAIPSDITATRSFWNYKYASPGTIDVTLSVANSGEPLTGLGVQEHLPAGWKFVSVVSGPEPDIAPAAQTTGTLEFAWINIPELPMQMTYRLSVPSGVSGDQTFSGAVVYSQAGPTQWTSIGQLSTIKQRVRHDSDYNPADMRIGLWEVIRAINFYNSGGYHIDPAGEDGFQAGVGSHDGAPHDLDYNTQDWGIGLWELIRLINFYNSGGYHVAEGTEDGFAPGLVSGLKTMSLKGFTTMAITELGIARATSPTAYTPGATLNVTVTFSVTGSDPLTALGLEEHLPAGWTYVKLVSGPTPMIKPKAGDNTLNFAWMDMPEMPFSLTYQVMAPAGETGTKQISGQGIYAVSGPTLSTPTVTTDISSAVVPTPIHNITKGTNYTTVAAAIADASTSDVLVVDAGTYSESVAIGRSLTLRSASGTTSTVINGGLSLDASKIRIEGFTINGGHDFAGHTAAITVGAGTVGHTIVNNTLVGPVSAGVGILAGSLAGQIVITDNAIRGWQQGIKTDAVEAFCLDNNHIYGNVTGIDGVDMAMSMITDNVITSNSQAGITIAQTGAGIEAHGNSIYGNSIAGLVNAGGETIDARKNWWGDSSGPGGGAEDPMTHRIAGGSGNAISSSLNVRFDGWLESAGKGWIIIRDPQGGETWDVGATQTVTWDSQGFSGNVNIWVLQGIATGLNWVEVAANTANDGSEQIVVPAGPQNRSDIWIWIEAASDTTIHDQSLALASYGNASITLTSPVGGETWIEGSTHNITWSSQNVSGNLRIWLYRAGAWEILYYTVPATENSIAWTAGIDPTAEARIWIESLTDRTVFDKSDPFTIQADLTPVIKLTSPVGGEQWEQGSTHTITWTSANVGNVDVLLYNGSSWETIASNIANTGQTSWTITQAGTTRAKIQVRSTADPGVYAVSYPFTIIGVAPFAITSPVGGEQWMQGSSYTITWNPGTLAGNVDILLYNGASWVTLVANTANDGSENWTITQGATDRAKIQIRSVNNNTIYTVSYPFTIVGAAPFGITSPIGGESWAQGETHTITWNPGLLAGNVDVLFYNGKSWSTIAANTANDGSQDWTITQAATTRAKIQIRSVNDNNIYTVSYPFTIIGIEPFGITSPTGGESWMQGDTHTITWNPGLLSGNVDILLYNGTSWETLAANTPNDGSENWTITQGATKRAKIQIRSVNDPAVYTVSYQFTILGIPPFGITSPTGSEQWRQGETHTITWNPGTLAGNVDILFYTGSSWVVLFANTSNDGQEDWTITQATTNKAKIQIRSVNDHNVYTVSYPFKVLAP